MTWCHWGQRSSGSVPRLFSWAQAHRTAGRSPVLLWTSQTEELGCVAGFHDPDEQMLVFVLEGREHKAARPWASVLMKEDHKQPALTRFSCRKSARGHGGGCSSPWEKKRPLLDTGNSVRRRSGSEPWLTFVELLLYQKPLSGQQKKSQRRLRMEPSVSIPEFTYSTTRLLQRHLAQVWFQAASFLDVVLDEKVFSVVPDARWRFTCSSSRARRPTSEGRPMSTTTFPGCLALEAAPSDLLQLLSSAR